MIFIRKATGFDIVHYVELEISLQWFTMASLS